ncbi:DNA-packaging protein [Croceicoccus naphthovorans]|uniref:ATP-binding protein n=1 Tax=Croceicoccus naphthovorans TaxID=1348774 RepID=A0A0G3XIS8_9SPHN|nr:ATP-binding protein [Croceicoccus naphthovorans]
MALGEVERSAILAGFSKAERDGLRYHWELWARTRQLPPPGDWRVWLICAGRGFGKTRAGSEWVRHIARSDPNARIALIGASLAETRAVMVEGESGILACCPPRNKPRYEPSLRRLTFPNGASATLYSASEPDSLRGPQHSHAWCDEAAKWEVAGERAGKAWDNMLMGLRLGEMPRVLVTTTPRAVPLMRKLMAGDADGKTVIVRGQSKDNASNLPTRFLHDMERDYGGTALGRQELDGELLLDVDGALWTRSLIERCRAKDEGGDLSRVVVGVDPPASARGDACGIVVAALGSDGVARVMADCSVTKPTPERWARAAAAAAAAWHADRIVAEANQGGAMVESVLRAVDVNLPVRLVHASRGKVARAEPVAALYEAGRVLHVGAFPELEDELAGLSIGGEYNGPGRSPDRADALVWALTELMLGAQGRPRVWMQ